MLMARVERHRVRRDRHRDVLLAAQPRRGGGHGGAVQRPAPAAAATSITSTKSTTPSSSSRSRRVDRGAVEGRGCRRASTARSTASGSAVSASSSDAAPLQTGSIRTYAASLFARRRAIVGYYLLAQFDLSLDDASITHRLSAAGRRAAGALAGGRGDRPDREPLVRNIALVASLVTFAATLLLWSRFDPSSADYQFVERYAWMPTFGIQYPIGVDGISLFLIVLTGFLTPLALLSSWESVHKSVKASRSSSWRSRPPCSACSSRSICSCSTCSGTRC